MSPSKVSNVPASRGMNASLADPTVASPTPVYLAATLPGALREGDADGHTGRMPWSEVVVGCRFEHLTQTLDKKPPGCCFAREKHRACEELDRYAFGASASLASRIGADL